MQSNASGTSWSNAKGTTDQSLRVCVQVLIAIALVAGLLLRLAGLSSPPFDAHSFRQTQTLSTIETYYAHGIDLLHPKTIYAGYPGTFVLELPLFQAVAALLYNVFGPHLEIVRVLNIALGAAAMCLLFRITAFFLDRTTAWLASLIYWLAPLNILYQRSMLIDPMAVFCGLLAFHQLALLLVPRDGNTRDGNVPRKWLQFAFFAVATLLTVLIKALYLWPAVLLLGQQLVVQRFKLDMRTVRVLAVFAVAGACFLVWNAHAARVNNASPFTEGVMPTSLLGVSALVSPDFYYEMLVRRPKWWLGALGALLYPVGLLAIWKERHARARSNPLMLLFLIPPTYLLLFSSINRPHSYYQLIITPFLAVVSANGLRWLAVWWLESSNWPSWVRRVAIASASGVFVMAAVLTYLVWLKMPLLNDKVIKFEQDCAGKFDPGQSAMLFVAAEATYLPQDCYIPEYLYAAKLWGYCRTVDSTEGGRHYFEELAPAFTNLEYVVFYGTLYPDWMTNSTFRPEIQDDENQFYIFRRDSLQ